MRILIADADSVRSKVLTEVCERGNHTIERVTHGAAALELALERPPHVVICPLDLRVIDGTRLAEILRSNPRTRGASFIFLVKDELDAPLSMNPRDCTVGAPWKPEAMLERLRSLQEREARFQDVRPDTEMEGKLSQVSLVDLLQLFQMNQKSGTLRITRDQAPGPASIVIRMGQVTDASIPLADSGVVAGEKALYRMLTWKDGRFEFRPGDVKGGGRIRTPMRALLMDGMRQLDEGEKQRALLPPDDARLRLMVAREKFPANIHPLTREVIDAVEQFGLVGDVLDQCSFPDYQVLRALADLLRRGGVEVESGSRGALSGDGESAGGLFAPSQVQRLREWAVASRPQAGSVLKVLVVGAGREQIQQIYQALRECADFRSNARLAREPARVGSLASLGHIHLGEGLSLRVIAMPADPAYAPLWNVAAHAMLGAIVLPGDTPEATEDVLRHLRTRSPRALLHLVLAPDGSTTLSEETPAALGAQEGEGVFVLPDAASGERVAVLRNVFAGLVP